MSSAQSLFSSQSDRTLFRKKLQEDETAWLQMRIGTTRLKDIMLLSQSSICL